MRPPGEVRQALLDAARALTTENQGPTLVEMAARAQVGLTAAAFTTKNMVRSGALVIVRERRVSYRNRPVAEYGTPDALLVADCQTYDPRPLMACWAAQAA